MEFTVCVDAHGLRVYEIITIDKRAFAFCNTDEEIIAMARSIYRKEHPNAFVIGVAIGRRAFM